MPRVKRGIGHLKKRRSLLKRVKGFRHGRKNLLKLAKTADMKAGANAYNDRRRKKRTMRGLWQIRINAAARKEGMSYSKFIGALKEKSVGLNRKVLSEMANEQPGVFSQIAKFVK